MLMEWGFLLLGMVGQPCSATSHGQGVRNILVIRSVVVCWCIIGIYMFWIRGKSSIMMPLGCGAQTGHPYILTD